MPPQGKSHAASFEVILVEESSSPDNIGKVLNRWPLPWLTTHFLMCFSRVEGTENGISQNLHLYTSLPILPCVFMCRVSLELWAHA